MTGRAKRETIPERERRLRAEDHRRKNAKKAAVRRQIAHAPEILATTVRPSCGCTCHAPGGLQPHIGSRCVCNRAGKPWRGVVVIPGDQL